MTKDELESLREGWDFEAKAAAGRSGRGQLPDDFWPTYSAMANTSGGKVALGVKEERDGTLVVQGLLEPEPIVRDLWNLLNNRQKVSGNVLDHNSVHIEEIDGKQVVLIDIPRAGRDQRPVYLGANPLVGTFLRLHEGDRLASEDRVRRMLADSDRGRPRDGRVLRGFGLDDLDGNTIAQYRNQLASRKPDHPFLREDTKHFLLRLGAWTIDREAGIEGLTLAGLLLFGNEHAIRSELPAWQLDYQEHNVISIREGRRWSDRVAPDGTWTANLLEFYWRVYPRLVQGLQIPFELDSSGVRRAETPVHEALREALVNSLVHADYGGPLGIRVLRRPEGLEFRNPGLPLVSLDQMRRGGESQSRNPVIQQALTLIGLGERAGSGVPTILNAWRGQHWRPPGIDLDAEADTTTLRLATLSLFPSDALEELARRFGDAFSSLQANARLAVATAYIEGKVTNRRMQELSSMHPRDLTFMLRRLVEMGLLDPHGDRQGAWYTVGEGREPEFPAAAASAQGYAQSSAQSSAQSPAQSSIPLAQGSGSAHSGGDLDQSLPRSARVVASSAWATRSMVEQAISEIAAGGFVTAEELARILNRSARTLQQNYLRTMVDAGKLELRYPEKRTRPDQAYRTAKALDPST